jgi:hypothetical protein
MIKIEDIKEGRTRMMAQFRLTRMFDSRSKNRRIHITIIIFTTSFLFLSIHCPYPSVKIVDLTHTLNDSPDKVNLSEIATGETIPTDM